MRRINVLSIERISAEDRTRIEAVDPAVQLTNAGGWYDGEIRETWPVFASARYLTPSPIPPAPTTHVVFPSKEVGRLYAALG
jgi:hypothetical protein